jgi:hypothetical protein
MSPSTVVGRHLTVEHERPPGQPHDGGGEITEAARAVCRWR